MTRVGVANIMLAKDKQRHIELPSMDRSSIITLLSPNFIIRLEARA